MRDVDKDDEMMMTTKMKYEVDEMKIRRRDYHDEMDEVNWKS